MKALDSPARLSLRVVLAAMMLVCSGTPPASAQSAENVAIVINDASATSQRIGAHYARIRGLPPENVIHVNAPTDEAVDRADYSRTIETPIGRAIGRAGLHDRLLFIVLTKGVPLRINGSGGLQGSAASVDSELTLLYRRLAGEAVTIDGPIDNPYFLRSAEVGEARRFSHRDHDIYLVTRLDGFSAEDALALIDRAQIGTTDGRIVLDQRAAPPASQLGDEWLERAARRLDGEGHGDRVVLERTPAAARPTGDVLGLYSWGASDPEQRRRRTGLNFAPGAIAAHFASFNARTFQPPSEGWVPTAGANRTAWYEGSGDSLIGDLIREGVTGVSGQVGEAFMRAAVRPDILFSAYMAGCSLAEAFYLAVPALSWQTVVIGDPLAAPFATRRLSRGELEEPVDPETGFPALFSQRRLATLAAVHRDVPPTALAGALRALSALDRDDKPTAAGALRSALQQSPRDDRWLTYLGTLQEQAADYEAAVATYQDVLTRQPTNVVALNNAAYVLSVHLGRPTDALPLARRAASLSPRQASVLDTLAWTEHLLGNNEAAATRLEQALRYDSRQAEIRLHAAIVYAALGRHDRSERHLNDALRLDPELESHEEVQRLRHQSSPRSQ